MKTLISITKDMNLRIKTPPNPLFLNIVRTLPGRRWMPHEQRWSLPLTNLDELIQLMIEKKLWTDEEGKCVKRDITDILDHTKINVSHVTSKMIIPYRPYQVDTLKFFMHRGSALGGLGFALGKTGISLGYVMDMIQQKKVNKVLTLGTKPSLWHWVRESEKFFGKTLRTLVIGSEVSESGKVRTLKREERMDQWCRDDIDMFIATYDIPRRDFIDEEPLPNDKKKVTPTRAWTGHWDGSIPYALIIDEVTKIKSFQATRTRFLKHMPARYRVGLSGKPMENRLEELFVIMDWIWPGCLGSYNKFKTDYIVSDVYGNPISYKNVDGFRDKLKWMMIHYSVDEVLPYLPKVTHNTYDVVLSNEESKEYDRIKDEITKEFALFAEAANRGERVNTVALLAWLTMARMYCDHPLLVKRSESKTAKLLSVECKKSSKLEDLLLILDEIEGEKVVIFSQFVGMLNLIEDALRARYPMINIYKLVGGKKSHEYQRLIDNFASDRCGGYFLSSDTGATSIELQCAHYLIHYDQHWNPAIMDQRVGRLRRPGQTQPVVAIYLSVPDQDKVEARVKEVLSKKRELYHDVIETLFNQPMDEH